MSISRSFSAVGLSGVGGKIRFSWLSISMGRKLTVIIVAISSVTLLLACSAMGTYDVFTFRRASLHNLSTLSDWVATYSMAPLISRDAEAGKAVLAELRTQSDITAACIYTPDGSLLASYLRDSQRASTCPQRGGSDQASVERGRVRQFRAVRWSGERIGTVFLESDFEEMRKRLRAYPFVMGLILLTSSLIALGLATRLQKLVSQPILDLVEATKKVSNQRNYALRLPLTSHDEVGLLGNSFNQMLSQIEQRDEELQAHQDNLGKFDVAFMDMQVPERHGLRATAAIRELEKGSREHLPIFAMTAHAKESDREICLQAGMDGYNSKPARFDDVEHRQATRCDLPSMAAPSASSLENWSRDEALQRLGGDEDLLRELCRIFLEESPKLIEALRQAVAAGNPEGVRHAAHSLRGEVSCLAASRATKLLRQIERMARDANLANAQQALTALDRELAELSAALKTSEESGAVTH